MSITRWMGIRGWTMVAAVVVLAATVPADAGTEKRASVSGVTRGSTVSVEATVQCPQGQPQCNAPQDPSGVLSLSWPDSRAEFQIQLGVKSPRDSVWEVRGQIKVEGDLPAGKTASGDFALTMNENYAITSLKASVSR